jgi:hypothetical protein
LGSDIFFSLFWVFKVFGMINSEVIMAQAKLA